MGIKYKVNEDFFKKWSQEMAYTLGYIYADGSLEDASYIRGKYIRVSSVEKRNIEKIKEWMNSEHTIIIKKPTSKNGRVGYLLRIGSHALYNDLVKLGLYPNKSLTVKFPSIPKKFLCHFVRGYFDGDGCVRLSMEKGVFKKLSTVFTSGSKVFLQDLAIQLQSAANTKQLNVYNGHRSYMLSYSTSDSIKLFKFFYGKATTPIFLERKAEVYSQYFQLKPERLDKKVKSVLQCLS
jgi:hypothetical protein